MEKISIVYLLLVLLVPLLLGLTLRCTTSKKYTFEKLPKNQIVFGAGGGFTGVQSEYCLSEDGQLFEKKSASEYQRLRKIEKQLTKNYFAQCRTLQLERVMFNEPGDLFYYIRLRGEKEAFVQWGKKDKTVRMDIQQFYDEMTKLLPK